MSMRERGWPRAGRWLCLVAVVTVLVAGCSFASGMIRTLSALSDAGIHNPDISGGSNRVTLTYDSNAGASGVRHEQDRAAEVIWDNFPLRFSELTVIARTPTTGSADEQTYSRSDLEEEFGPRPPGLDNTTGDVEEAARSTVRNVVIGLIIGGTVLLALVVLVIVLVVRAARRRPAAPAPPLAPGWGQARPGAQQGWGQSQQGWGQQWSQQPGYGEPGGQPGYGQPAEAPPAAPREASDETVPLDGGAGEPPAWERPADQGPTPPR